MPYSQKKSKGRKTPSVKKSQKNPKRKSQKKSKRKSPSVGSVRKGHLGRPSAEQTLSNHNEKRNYAGTQSYISINEDQLRAIKKLMNDSCDKKNEKKLINKFPEFFKSEICKEIRFGFEYSKLNTSYLIRNTQYVILNTEYVIVVTQYLILNTLYVSLAT